ncbi:MAG: NADPH-dependent F420 reductase [Leptolyngbyaceae cyanobacterium RM2_2_4]|nr:NADPH-dependent F420 reductase [Leptolyngbyaceae cyanobacterium RM2_2_4]
MNIGIIGSGNMGAALGKLWAQAGHQVIFSYSRDANKLQDLAMAAGSNAKVGTPEEAVTQSDIVMLAVGFPSLEAILRMICSPEGKIIITCISALHPDFTGQTIGIVTDLKLSIAEAIQQVAPKAKVVEAFNMTFAEILASNTRQFGVEYPSIFYCGDDEEAKKTVAGLIVDCGYEAIDAGDLIVARSLETLATAWVQFAVSSQLFPNLGLKALRR